MRCSVLVVSVLAALATACSGEPAPVATPTRADPAVVAVYLRDDATEAQKQAVEAELRVAPGAGSVTFVSREEAYREFKKVFEDDPKMDGVRAEDLDDSFRVRLADRADAPSTLKAVRGLAGVDSAKVLPTPSPTTTP